LAGGLGGAANATLCYLKLPVPVQESTQAATFQWHIVPAGFAHGAVLALIAIMALGVMGRRNRFLAFSATPFVAWFAGYASWIPIGLSISDESLLHALAWPVRDGNAVSALVGPAQSFGGVAGLLYLLFLVAGRTAERPPVAAILATLAGALGSLWWWIEWETWYFSLLHGGIWGSLVGLAMGSDPGAAEQ